MTETPRGFSGSLTLSNTETVGEEIAQGSAWLYSIAFAFAFAISALSTGLAKFPDGIVGGGRCYYRYFCCALRSRPGGSVETEMEKSQDFTPGDSPGQGLIGPKRPPGNCPASNLSTPCSTHNHGWGPSRLSLEHNNPQSIPPSY